MLSIKYPSLPMTSVDRCPAAVTNDTLPWQQSNITRYLATASFTTYSHSVTELHVSIAHTLLYSRLPYVQCESTPLTPRFSDIFPKRLGIFSPNFTRLLHVPIYAGLHIFIQLSITVTKLCHIKCDHPACVSADDGHIESYARQYFICKVDHTPAATPMVKIRHTAPMYEIKLINLV